MAQPSKFSSMLRRRGWIIGLLLVGATCTSIIVAYEMTPLFRSEGRVLVEEGDIPSDLISTTVRGFVEERIELVRKRVYSADNIRELVDEHSLYSEADLQVAGKSAVQIFRGSSAVLVEELADGTISFLVSFDHNDPRKARDVVNSLLDLFLKENVASRTQSATETAKFLENEAGRLAVRIAEFEMQIALYKEENRGGLPEQQNLNAQMLDRAERELDDVGGGIRALEQRRSFIESDIARHRANVSFAGEAPPPGSADRLRYLQAEYLRMMSIYSSEHPDLVRVRREIELLSPGAADFNKRFLAEHIRVKELELRDLLGRYSSDHPDVIALQKQVADLREDFRNAPDDGPVVDTAAQDPELMRLTAEREGIDKELAAQRSRQRQLRSNIADFQSRLTGTPRVELELLELTRGYDQLREKYDDIKLKQTQVELAVSAEQAQRAGRFGIVTSPLMATSPAIPNRPAVIFLGFLVGLGLGFATAASLEGADKTIRDQNDVREIWGAPPLVAIPEILNHADSRRRLFRTSVYSFSIAAMIIGATVSVIGAPA